MLFANYLIKKYRPHITTILGSLCDDAPVEEDDLLRHGNIIFQFWNEKYHPETNQSLHYENEAENEKLNWVNCITSAHHLLQHDFALRRHIKKSKFGNTEKSLLLVQKLREELKNEYDKFY